MVLSIAFGIAHPAWTVVLVLALAASISQSIHHAEAIAFRLGSAWGTIILALAVTVIEVALIVSLMSNGGPDSATVARDTVFSAVMIVTNGTLGVSLLLGGLKHRELQFQVLGESAWMSTLVALTVFTFILPNFTTSVPGPSYSQGQLIFVSLMALGGYCALLWAQTRLVPEHFAVESSHSNEALVEPQINSLWKSVGGLVITLITVVGLAKILSKEIESWVSYFGAPNALVGVVVAMLVLAPETFAAIKAARVNRLQESMNLALGSAVASIALTIPIVSAYSLATGHDLNLGIQPKEMVLLLTTFLTSAMTLGSGRASFLHGMVHLGILAGYVALTLMP